jgi:hypothetical protein
MCCAFGSTNCLAGTSTVSCGGFVRVWRPYRVGPLRIARFYEEKHEMIAE